MRSTQLAFRRAEVPIQNPLQIAALGTAQLKRWCRGDDVTLATGKVSSWTNKADAANPGVSVSPRQPTWLADGGNGRPAIQFLGDNEPTAGNRDEMRWPGYARPAPSVQNNFQILIVRKDGNEVGSNRMIVADTASGAFQIKRPSTTVADIVMVNSGSNANTNTGLVNGTISHLEWVFANSLDTHMLVGGILSSGSFAGDNAGTAASLAVTQAGTGWMALTIWELIEFWGQLNALQLAKMRAYIANRYTGIVI